jgi:hypothetical protein
MNVLNLLNPSSRTMALGFIQLLTEIITKNIKMFLGSREWPTRKADKLIAR